MPNHLSYSCNLLDSRCFVKTGSLGQSPSLGKYYLHHPLGFQLGTRSSSSATRGSFLLEPGGCQVPEAPCSGLDSSKAALILCWQLPWSQDSACIIGTDVWFGACFASALTCSKCGSQLTVWALKWQTPYLRGEKKRALSLEKRTFIISC